MSCPDDFGFPISAISAKLLPAALLLAVLI